MGRYRIECPHCGHKRNQYLPSESETRVVRCPNCGRGVSARMINNPNTTLVEKDGYIGVFEEEAPDDSQRHRRRRL